MAKIYQKIVVQVEDLKPNSHDEVSSDCTQKNRTRKKVYSDYSKGVSYQFHCPVAGCIYDINSERSFTCIKYLRQHYQKIHAAKVFFCERCKKGFAKPAELTAHVQSCGSTFTCSCGYEYSTRAALLTHAKRKMHTLPREQQSGFRKLQKAKQQTSLPATFQIGGKWSDSAQPPTVIILVNSNVDAASLKLASASSSPTSSPSCDGATTQKPCFILPKPAPLDSLAAQAIAAMALSELSSGSCISKRLSVGVQTANTGDHVCNCRESSNNSIAKRSAETQTIKSELCKRRTRTTTSLYEQGTQTALPDYSVDLSCASTQTLLAFGGGSLLEPDMFGNGQVVYPYSNGGGGGWPLSEGLPMPMSGVSPFSLVNDKFSQTMEDLGVNVTFPLCGSAVSSGTQTSPGCARLPVEQLDQSLHCYLGMDNLPSLQDYAVDSPGEPVRQLSSQTQTERLDSVFLAAGGDSDAEDEAAILCANIQTQTSSDLESMALQQLLQPTSCFTQTTDQMLFPDLSSLCNSHAQKARYGSPNVVHTHTQTHRDRLLGFAVPQSDTETQTFPSYVESGDALVTDSHTQTPEDILALLDYCSGDEDA